MAGLSTLLRFTRDPHGVANMETESALRLLYCWSLRLCVTLNAQSKPSSKIGGSAVWRLPRNL